MADTLPKEPKHTWKSILLAIDEEYGQHSTFTSRDIATLLGIEICNASMRIQRARQWSYIKCIGTKAHNVKVYELTNLGVTKADKIRKEL